MIINVLLVGFILLAVYNILLDKNGIKNSFIWIVIAFVFGYRTIEPVSGLKLHPIEILTYIACTRIIFFKSKKYYKMPKPISLISFLFSIHFILDVVTRYSWLVLLEFKNSILMVNDNRMPIKKDEQIQIKEVRFRTLGCYPLTGAVLSKASTLTEVIQEILLTITSERYGRLIDKEQGSSMEVKKQQGYF